MDKDKEIDSDFKDLIKETIEKTKIDTKGFTDAITAIKAVQLSGISLGQASIIANSININKNIQAFKSLSNIVNNYNFNDTYKGYVSVVSTFAESISSIKTYGEGIQGLASAINTSDFKNISNAAVLAHLNFSDSIKNISEGIQSLQSVLNTYNFENTAALFNTNYISSVRDIQSMLSSIDIPNIDIDDLKNYKASEEEIEETQQLIDEIFIDDDKNIEQKIYEKCIKIKGKNPLHYIVIAFIITTMLQFLINMLLQTGMDMLKNSFNPKVVNQASDKQIKDAKKATVIQITNNFNEDSKIIFKNYRYIKVDKAYIRTSQSMSSKIIKELHKGDIIRIITKNNHWSNVDYIDDDGNVYSGWINTIYTRRFD